MRNMKRTWVVLVATAALLVTAAGAASAGNHITGDGDTMLNLAYDAENHVFIADVSATGEAYDCTLDGEMLTVGYGDGESFTIPIASLEDADGTFAFPAQPVTEPPTDPALYEGSEGVCGLIGTYFEGAIDHGTFMEAFHAYLDTLDLEGGRGCLVRIVAQSDLGKGDQQVTEDDVDPEFAMGSTGSVEFTTGIADCAPGKPEDAGQANSHSEEPHGQSGEEHGKSASRGGGR